MNVLDYSLMKLIKSHILSKTLAFLKNTAIWDFLLVIPLASYGPIHTYLPTDIMTEHRALDVLLHRRLVTGPLLWKPGSSPGQSMWGLWWKKWQWDRIFLPKFGFPLSVSFHKCSINIHSSVTDAIYSQQLTASLNITIQRKHQVFTFYIWGFSRKHTCKSREAEICSVLMMGLQHHIIKILHKDS
jgi:hypothetical protein